MFAVMPLTWCPHLVEVQPLPEIGIDADETCQECWHAGENWLCLTCYTVSDSSRMIWGELYILPIHAKLSILTATQWIVPSLSDQSEGTSHWAHTHTRMHA